MQRSRTLSARRALRGSCAAPSTSHRFVHDGRRVSFGSFQKAIHRALIQRGPAALTLTTSLKDPYGDVYDDGGSPTRIDAGGSACACSQPAPPGAIGGCHRSASPFLRHMAHRHKVFRCLHQQGRIQTDPPKVSGVAKESSPASVTGARRGAAERRLAQCWSWPIRRLTEKVTNLVRRSDAGRSARPTRRAGRSARSRSRCRGARRRRRSRRGTGSACRRRRA
jgi:hypothetical protein